MKTTMTAYVNGSPIAIEPQQMVIDEAEGLHDMATLTFGGFYGRDIVKQLDLGNVAANDIGPPAVVEVITGSVLVRFYGYIDTAVETRSSLNDTTVQLYFLSSSSIMRNGSSRVWHGKLPFEIAKDILKPYGLGLEMDKVPYPMESFTQSDESDWEALRNLAVRNGLSLTSSASIIQMRDVINTTRRAKGTSLTPRFRRPGSYRVNSGLEATGFTQVASRTPMGAERYRYYGIDHLGVAFEVAGGVSAISKSPGTVVSSLGSALREARRHEAMGRFVTRATLDSPGLVGCSAGECIIVESDTESEYWYISSSKHSLVSRKDEHHMTLELCRQEGVSPGYISAVVPRRPTTVLIGKEWRCDRFWAVEL
jgi:hypothetical protein